MQGYKIRCIVDFIRSKGPLPRDETGSILSGDDLLAWYGLRDRLTPREQVLLLQELWLLAEAETFIEQLRLASR